MTGVWKSYMMGKSPSMDVLRGIDLDIKRGEFISIMGPSGSGKSTLMNLIGLLDRPDSASSSSTSQKMRKAERRRALRTSGERR